MPVLFICFITKTLIYFIKYGYKGDSLKYG